MANSPSTPQTLFPTEVQGGAGGGGLFGGGINPTAVQWQAQQQQRYNQVTGLANLLNWASTSGVLGKDAAAIAGGQYLRFLGEKDPYKALPNYTKWLQETLEAHRVGTEANQPQQVPGMIQPGPQPPPGMQSGSKPAALPATPNGQVGANPQAGSTGLPTTVNPSQFPPQQLPSVAPPPGSNMPQGFGVGWQDVVARNQALDQEKAMAPMLAHMVTFDPEVKMLTDKGIPQNQAAMIVMSTRGGVTGAFYTAQAQQARYGYRPDGTPMAPGEMSAYTSGLVNRMNAQAGQDRYKTTPVGVFDTQTSDFVPGASYNQPVTVTPELQQQDPILRQFKVGEVLTPQALASLYRANAAGTTTYQSGAGPAALNKVSGQVTPLPGGPVSWGAPKEVVSPNTGMPALMPAGQAMKTGAVPTTPQVFQGQMGIRGQMSDIDSNLPRLQAFVQKGVFNNLGVIDRGIIAESLKNPDSTTAQIALSELQGRLTDDQINAISTLKNMYAALGGVRKLLGNSPIASDKRYQAFTTELVDPSDILAGGRIAGIRLQNFARAYSALRQPMEQYLNRSGVMGGSTPQPPPGSEPSLIYARDPQGKLHKAAAGTKLPAGWKAENAPATQ